MTLHFQLPGPADRAGPVGDFLPSFSAWLRLLDRAPRRAAARRFYKPTPVTSTQEVDMSICTTPARHGHHARGASRADHEARRANNYHPAQSAAPAADRSVHESRVSARPSIDTLEQVAALYGWLREACRASVQGRDDVIELVLIALLADGHVLLEDHPGSGKTTLAKALGSAIVRPAGDERIASFRRIQFTPDLLPSDVTGTTIFDAESNRFDFHPGPVFANVVLADEINRTGPKVQAALLEAMAEKQVTVDSRTYALDPLFFVLATQNPLDLHGTYPLPAAQLDRFLFKVTMNHLARESELAVLAARAKPRHEKKGAPVDLSVSSEAIVSARETIGREVQIGTMIHECLVDIGHAMRSDHRVLQSVSTRSLVLAIEALKARAAVHGRDFVSPRDVKALVGPLFGHRLVLKSAGVDAQQVIAECAMPVLESAIRKSMK
jgi:MoxR-like ATPase